MAEDIKELKEQVKKANELVKSLQEKLQELQNKPKNIRWRAKHFDEYFCVATAGGIGECCEHNNSMDDFLYNTGNYFKCRREAEEYREYLMITQKLKDIASRLNNGVKIDWTSCHQSKHSILLNYTRGVLYQGTSSYHQTIGTTYCLSDKFLEEAIKEIGEKELIEYIKGE